MKKKNIFILKLKIKKKFNSILSFPLLASFNYPSAIIITPAIVI